MPVYTIHNGAKFKVEKNPFYGSMMIVCKCSGRYAYLRREQADKLQDALSDGWKKFGRNADADDVWEWLWLNCGFHRLAS